MNTTQGQRTNRNHSFRQTKHAILLTTAFLAVSTVSMVGCASTSKSVINGRVISGTVGQSVSASPGDIRFDEPGIPGATVTILTKSGNASRGRGVYTKVTSDEFGNFELNFANGQYPRDSVQVRVEGDGFYTSRSNTFLPPEGDSLLCVVITRPGYVIPEPAEPESKK